MHLGHLCYIGEKGYCDMETSRVVGLYPLSPEELRVDSHHRIIAINLLSL